MRKLPIFLGLVLLFAAGGAASADNIFAVKGIHVDATAGSASDAKNKAIASGEPQAWTELFRKLTRQQDWSKQPKLDSATLTKILRGYSVANEKRSTTRYVADITYVFNPDAVAKILQGANISFTQMAGKTVLVIPLSPGYAPNSPWAQAWKDPSVVSGLVPVALPSGDEIDQSELHSLGIGTASWADVQPIASRVHATEADVVLASPGSGKIMVQMRRLAPGGQQGGLQAMANIAVPVAAGQTPQQAFLAAAQAANGVIQNAWKSKFAINFNQTATLTVDVTLGSLADWAEIQARLATIPTITGVTVVAMNTGAARLNIAYVGGADQLHEALSEANLTLTQNAGGWQLGRGSRTVAGDQ